MITIKNNAILSIVLTLLFNISSISSFAQYSEDHPKHENHYSVETIETSDVLIEFENAHSQQTFTTVKLKVTNKTSDYILYKSNESTFIYAHGDFKVNGAGVLKHKNILIEPNSIESITLKLTGGNSFHVKDLKLDLKGFYKVKAKGNVIAVPDFKLPAETNNFVASPFECFLKKSIKEAEETIAVFECTYKGSQVGMINSTLLSFANDNSTINYVNVIRKDKVEIIHNGEIFKFKAVARIPKKIFDMQLNTMIIKWNSSFIESSEVFLKMPVVEFVFNPDITLLKN